MRTLGRMRVFPNQVIIMELNKTIRQRAQSLRKNMTIEERHLWYDFLKTYPVQFKRQYTIGLYIADFYCYHAKLVVELDGSQHFDPDAAAYDAHRTEYMRQQGLEVLRISNLDVMRNFSSVCAAIDLAVQARLQVQKKPHPSSKSVSNSRF